MRFPVWIPAGLALAGCASAQGGPPAGLDGSRAPDAFEFGGTPAVSRPAPSAPEAGAMVRKALLSVQQGWGQPNPQPQDRPPLDPIRPVEKPSPGTGRSEEFSRNGFYLGIGFVDSKGEFEFDNPAFAVANIIPTPDNTSSAEGSGTFVRIGFRANPNIGLEAALDYVSYDLTEDPPGFDMDGTVDVFTLDFLLRVYIPVGRVEPYFLAGFGLGSASVDVEWNDDAQTTFVKTTGSMTVADFKFGLGADLYATRNLAVYLEWTMTLGFATEAGGASYSSTTSDLIFGLLFRF